MPVCTKFSVREIQLLIRDSQWCDQRSDLIVPNVSWGLLPYEADLLCVKKSGYVAEFEIKRSFEDFKKDFTKDHFHDAEIITYFYYVVPEKIVDKVRAFLLERFNGENIPAVIQFNEDGMLMRTKGINGFGSFGNEKRSNSRKITLEEKATIGRLASLRYWSIQEEICSIGYSEKDQRISKLKKYLNLTRKTVKRLSKMNGVDRWISCSSNLPDDDMECLVLFYNGKKNVAYYDNEKRCWIGDNDLQINRWIVAWTEIPVENLKDIFSSLR